MMGSCQSCCEWSDNETTSPYQIDKKRPRPQRPQTSTCPSCMCSWARCSCQNTTSSDTTTTTETDSDIEMGKPQYTTLTNHHPNGRQLTPQERYQQQQNQYQREYDNQLRQYQHQPTTFTEYRPEQLHTTFTLSIYPLNRCPPSFQKFYTTDKCIILTPELESLIQWERKGTWMNMVTGQTSPQPPPKYTQIEGLKAVPMRFELVPIPPHLQQINNNTTHTNTTITNQQTNTNQTQQQQSQQQLPKKKLTYKDIFRRDFDITITFVQHYIDDTEYGTRITARTPSAFNSLFYLPWLYKELSLYPLSFLHKTGLKNIILCEGLQYSGQIRKALPVVRSNLLYLDIFLEPVYYMQGVLHHEFFHLFDDKILFELKNPIKNPISLYTTHQARKLPEFLNSLLLTAAKSNDETNYHNDDDGNNNGDNGENNNNNITNTTNNINNTTTTTNENNDHIIDINPSTNSTTNSQQQPQQQSSQPQQQSLPKPFNSELQLDPKLDSYTIFAIYLIAEYITNESFVFRSNIIPSIVEQFLQQRMNKKSNKHKDKSTTTTNPPLLTPKIITNKLLSTLIRLFKLKPYFYRSFPHVLHLFKYPSYSQDQEKVYTNPSITQSIPIPIENAPILAFKPHPTPTLTPVHLTPTTILPFPTPLEENINEFKQYKPIFLLHPQYHQQVEKFYNDEIFQHKQQLQLLQYQHQHQQDIYNLDQQGQLQPQQQQQQQQNQIDFDNHEITNYPSLPIQINSLFHHCLPNYSRGRLYLAYFRTKAISDYIPEEYNHPYFPHRRYIYHSLQYPSPSSISAIPPSTLPDTEPILSSTYTSLPPLSLYQHLFWTQTRSEALRNGIDPTLEPMSKEPPRWHQPLLPLVAEPVGSDPLWLLLNYNTFRYGTGGSNTRDANASITLAKQQQQQQQQQNQLQLQDNNSNHVSSSISNNNSQNNSSNNNSNNLSINNNNSKKTKRQRHIDENDSINPSELVSLNDSINNINNDHNNIEHSTTHSSTSSTSSITSHDHGQCIGLEPLPDLTDDYTSQQHTHNNINNDGDETDCYNSHPFHEHSFNLTTQQSFTRLSHNNNNNSNNNQFINKINNTDIGFLNTYSMSAIEEDKAEIYSWLIRHPPAILNSSDPYIRAKGMELWRRLELFCPDINYIFLYKLIQHKPFRINPYDKNWLATNDQRGFSFWENKTTGQMSWIDPNLLTTTMPLFHDVNTIDHILQQHQHIHEQLPLQAQSQQQQKQQK